MTWEDLAESDEMEKQTHCREKGSVGERVTLTTGKGSVKEKCSTWTEKVTEELAFSWHITINHHKLSSLNTTPNYLQVPKLETHGSLTWFSVQSPIWVKLRFLSGMFEILFSPHHSLAKHGCLAVTAFPPRVPLFSPCGSSFLQGLLGQQCLQAVACSLKDASDYVSSYPHSLLLD